MKTIKEVLLENRPHLSQGSVTTYSSILKNLFYKAHDKSSPVDISWFERQDEIITLLHDIPSRNRKTILSGLIVINNGNHVDKYKKLMEEDGKISKDEILDQVKSESQSKNWVSQEEIRDLFDKTLKDVRPLFKKKSFKEFKPSEYRRFQDLIMLACMSGIFIPPRRSQDFTEMKIKDPIDKENDNYMTKTSFVFNKYKTAKFYGKQEVDIPKGLRILLNKFLRVNPYPYLFTDTAGSKMNSVKISQRLNLIFGKHVSVNILRHSYLSDKYKDVPNLKQMLRTSEEMGHSLSEALEYIKH
jgi:hypothetical protein